MRRALVRRRSADAGGAALATLLTGLVTAAVAAAVVSVTADLHLAAARAQTAADAAALAAAASSPLAGGDGRPCAAAARLAAANDARLVACDGPDGAPPHLAGAGRADLGPPARARSWPLAVHVAASVRPAHPLAARLVDDVRAHAGAAVRPRAGQR